MLLNIRMKTQTHFRRFFLLSFGLLAFWSFEIRAQVTGYTRSVSSSTYTPITGGSEMTVAGNFLMAGIGSTNSEPVNMACWNGSNFESQPGLKSTGFPIGFNFIYGGHTFNQFAIGSGGFIKLGTNIHPFAAGRFSYNSISWTSSGPFGVFGATGNTEINIEFDQTIRAMSRSLIPGPGVDLRYRLDGVAGSRVLTVQWSHWSRSFINIGDDISFQIKLHESGNTIEMIYGPSTYGNSTVAYHLGCQVGLRGLTQEYLLAGTPIPAITPTDRLMSGASSGTSWNSPGTFNTPSTTFSDLTATNNPSTNGPGLTYTWTPPVYSGCGSKGIVTLATSDTTVTISWTPSAFGTPDGYEIDMRSADSVSAFTPLPGSPFSGNSATLNLPYNSYKQCRMRTKCSAANSPYETFRIFVPGPGETCNKAIGPIPVAANSGSMVNTLVTAGFTQDGPSPPYEGIIADDDIWYSFVAPTDSSCVVITTSAYLSFDDDWIMELYDGCTGGPGNLISWNDDAQVGINFAPELAICPLQYVPGQTYFIRLYTYGIQRGQKIQMGLYKTILHAITGKVYWDKDQNCQPNGLDQGFSNRLVNVNGRYLTTSPSGDYLAYVTDGSYAVQYVHPSQLTGELSTCQANFQLPAFTIQSPTFTHISHKDIAITRPACPILSVEGSYDILRPCRKAYMHIKVANSGGQTAYMVKVTFRQPNILSFLSASVPVTWDATDSTYSFFIDSIATDHSVSVYVSDSVKCDPGLMGVQACSHISLQYSGECPPPSSAWDGVDLLVRGSCVAFIPTFTILNKGVAMTVPRSYKVFQDTLFVYQDSVQLSASDSLVFQIPNSGSGSTYRTEIRQSDFHPHSTSASANINCGALLMPNNPIVASAEFSQVEKDVCGTVRNSSDPNDKQVWPVGAGNEGKILPGTWLEYKIRFMNKGNDTAFNVVVVDSLSEDLDVSTFVEMLASHPYKVQVTTGTPAVLRFNFNNILLPDSVTNTERSQGFVAFRIRPKEVTLPGTQIRNRAGIYFDFNPAVMTNYTLNTLFDPVITPGILDSVVIISGTHLAESMQPITVFPNPTTGRFTVAGLSKGTIEVWSALGRRCLNVKANSDSKVQLDLSAFGRGMYWVRIAAGDKSVIRKVMVE